MNVIPRDAFTYERTRLLERYGAAYGREAFAIVWTNGLKGDASRQVTARVWPQTKPLPASDGGAYAAGLFKTRGRTRNPALIARASRLIVVECDTLEGLTAIEALDLPATWTVRSSLAHRQHRYFRWPAGIDDPEIVSIRFEASATVGDREHYYIVPPALHRNGTVYAFLPGLGPDHLPIAALPEESYRELLRRAGKENRSHNADVASSSLLTPLPPLPLTPEQLRHERLRRIAAARTFEEAERLAADPLAGGHSPFAYGQRVLQTACERILDAPQGSRHSVLNKSAYVVGGLIVATGLDRADVALALAAAAELAGLTSESDRAQTVRTIERGLAAGEAKPRPIPERAA